MMIGTKTQRSKAGFSLIEVMIATGLFAGLAFSMMGAVVYNARTTRLNANALSAKNLAQALIERMTIDEFANVNPPADGWRTPTNGGYANVSYGDATPVWLDRDLNIRCSLDYAFKGFGWASAGAADSLTDDRASWAVNEWAGDTIYLIDGRGGGQFATIASNTANRLVFSAPLSFAPNATTRYMINNGKTVEVTTRWEYMGREYSQTMESLIVNHRNDSNLGF